jgi:hypothetical protein
VDVAVSRVAEARDSNAMFCRQLLAKGHQIN